MDSSIEMMNASERGVRQFWEDNDAISLPSIRTFVYECNCSLTSRDVCTDRVGL